MIRVYGRIVVVASFFMASTFASDCDVHGVWYGHECNPYPSQFLYLQTTKSQKPVAKIRSFVDDFSLVYPDAYKIHENTKKQNHHLSRQALDRKRMTAEQSKDMNVGKYHTPNQKPFLSDDQNISTVSAKKQNRHLHKSPKPIAKENPPKQKVSKKHSFEYNDTKKHLSFTQNDKNTTKQVTSKAFKQSRNGIYVVKQGDTLLAIASRFKVPINEIIKLNNIDRKHMLKVGQKLKLPIRQSLIDIMDQGIYVVQSGDTLLAIAKRFGVDAKELAKINGIKDTSSIRSGTKLTIPFAHIVRKIEKEKKIQAKKRRLAQAKKRKNKKVRMLRPPGKRKLRVTATAYTSHRGQTDSTPFLAAWNNRLRPGMKVIAVSRDLISRYGLTNGSKVRIGGLPGVYTVRDKMNKRYRRRIDIYMGVDRRRALRWGRRSVVIYF